MVFIAVTCRLLRSSLPPCSHPPFLSFSFVSFLSCLRIGRRFSVSPTCQPGKMRNDRARSDSARTLFKIHERFYCYLPYRRASQKAVSRGREGEGHIERERKCGPHFRTVRVQRKRETSRGQRGGAAAGWEARTPRNILIVEFSVRTAYPLEPALSLASHGSPDY